MAIGGNKAQGYLRHMVSLWTLFHDSGHVLRPELYSKVERALSSPDNPCPKGKEAAAEYIRSFEWFKLMVSMLCNANNFRDDPIWHLQAYTRLREWAQEKRALPFAKAFLEHIKESETKTHIQVSDAFVVYAIEHPHLIEERHVNASVDKMGVMTTRPGPRHRLVTHVDYAHFTSYLKRRLREKPSPRQIGRRLSR
jgi:hypothetical protein